MLGLSLWTPWQREAISVGDLDKVLSNKFGLPEREWQREAISVGDLDRGGIVASPLPSAQWQREAISVGDLDLLFPMKGKN